MTFPASTRVATVQDEDRLLPPEIIRNAANGDPYIEFVWMVNEATDTIDGGQMVNTDNSTYCTFVVMPDPITGKFDVMSTSEWLPCDTD